ncbi:uncharacterized protein LOC128921781 [Zeugodacus cucurbitae]|uniref:uncharacterized protein LOC128921781 n=1 Tax=Zeugodacus cucurbitae TaxID=28588 RepID=UPI0023D9140E|nr:uncharacterized protein LOC128921781 [Zeugodacus cucurbitae]
MKKSPRIITTFLVKEKKNPSGKLNSKYFNLKTKIRKSSPSAERSLSSEINLDFNLIYPAKDNFLKTKWDNFKTKIVNYYYANIRIQQSIDLLNQAKTTKKIVLLPSARFSVDGNTKKKATIKDANESFVLQLTTISDYSIRIKEIIGDLISPDVKHWKLLVLLIEIVDLLFDSSFSNFDLDKLKNLIKAHHQLYILLYGNLKPKHHFLVHYPHAIEKCGPLKFIWAMRFEAKHKDTKIYFNNITSRVNPAYTAAIKSSFCFSNFLHKYKDGFPHAFNTETFITKDLTKEEYFPKILNFENINYQSVYVSTIIHYKGIEYKQNNFLAFLNEINCCIYKIKLFIYENEIIYVLCYPIEIIKFDAHFQSYETGIK